jgi:uncharacterized membrane protein (UPF0182 family)
MVAWLTALSDGDNYGELLLYKFSKEKLVYGPLQIEAKFDQDLSDLTATHALVTAGIQSDEREPAGDTAL